VSVLHPLLIGNSVRSPPECSRRTSGMAFDDGSSFGTPLAHSYDWTQSPRRLSNIFCVGLQNCICSDCAPMSSVIDILKSQDIPSRATYTRRRQSRTMCNHELWVEIIAVESMLPSFCGTIAAHISTTTKHQCVILRGVQPSLTGPRRLLRRRRCSSDGRRNLN
jgi:hypothetical protein